MLPQRKPITERVAGWSIRHRTLAIAGWLALVVAAILASGALGLDQSHSTDPGESGRADRVLDAHNGYVPPLENVLVQNRATTAPVTTDPETRAATRELVAALRPYGTVRSPLNDPRLVASDGRSGLVTVQIAGPDEAFRAHYDGVVKAVGEVAARHPDVRLAQAGDKSLADAVDSGIKDDMKRAEYVSLPLTVLILLAVFGSLVAAGIPLLLAVTTVAGTFGLLQVAGHWVPVNSAASSIVLLVGIAVGVDYSLFYLRRTREERAAGRRPDEALRVATRTSGHVVAVSGLTVMLCLAGLLLTGLDNFKGLTAGTVLVVGLAMVGSVTFLPALLSALGRGVDAVRLPWIGRRRTAAAPSRFWTAVASRVVRRPLLCGGLAVLTLVLLTLPALSMRLQDAAVTDSLPRSVPVVDAAVRMQRAFPGSPAPASVVLWEKRPGALDAPDVATAVAGLHPTVTARSGGVLVARVPLAHFGTGPEANRSLLDLRHRSDTAFGGMDGVGHAVAGKTAFAYDFTEVIKNRSVPVVGAVLALAFVLLAVAFRSLAVSLVSILLNLLSIGAAYGVLAWGFQDGHLGGLLGFTGYGGVIGWLPLFMFVILFGLSMDYHIFILSRVREHRAEGVPARAAVVSGVGATSGVVTSAAAIMTCAFSVFVVLSAIEYKMMGVGLAAAILIDATIVRGVLLPAALALLGDRLWRSAPAAPVPRPEPANRT
ncbi:MMPL family transporter [Actinomadura rupiterrae]|uniref:MMPL family transporter n=1 Tax=Actinomadura rupiterrae TaxID=559627 RepID=UPI0020A5A161|nr:MMPL family transporter [Actinomadura rupiterrae]MCP2341357.1 RND superfamily putative drug exporter [Actinomadura rupiterrae]